MHRLQITIVLTYFIWLSGCATPLPPLNFYPSDVVVSSRKIDADLRSITVVSASPEQATGQIDVGIGTREMWKDSLETALVQMAIFQDDAERKVSIGVTILRLAGPDAGFSMTTDTSARYEIIDRKTGTVLFTKDINASSTVPANYAFSGFTRMRESANRAVQENIRQFLRALASVSLSK